MSLIEAQVFKQLKGATKKFKIKDLAYESERLPYVIEADYVPDFKVEFEDGRTMYVECKGWLRPEDKKKMKLVREQHKDKDIRFVFQRNNRFTRSKVKYGDWADRIGYPWTVGVIPEEWLK